MHMYNNHTHNGNVFWCQGFCWCFTTSHHARPPFILSHININKIKILIHRKKKPTLGNLHQIEHLSIQNRTKEGVCRSSVPSVYSINYKRQNLATLDGHRVVDALINPPLDSIE